MSIKQIWNLLIGKTKVLKPAKITWSNIKAVFQSFVRKQQIAGFELDPHIYEQIIWRRTKVMEKEPECWESGHCIVCGCDILGKTMEDRACSYVELDPPQEPCYPAMMNKEEWKEYKKLNNIKLFE